MEVDIDDLDDSVEAENLKTTLTHKIYEGHKDRNTKHGRKRGRKPQTPQDPNKKVRKWIYNPDWEAIPEFQKWLTKSIVS